MGHPQALVRELEAQRVTGLSSASLATGLRRSLTKPQIYHTHPYVPAPCRLKRFAIPAFMIIACVRGMLLNFGVYYSTRAALGVAFQWSPIIRCAPAGDGRTACTTVGVCVHAHLHLQCMPYSCFCLHASCCKAHVTCTIEHHKRKGA